MEKKEINLSEINNVYDSLKELYLSYCEELDAKQKDLDALQVQKKELEDYISYLEDHQRSDTFVFSPRGVVGKSGTSGTTLGDSGKVIDFTMKEKKQEELEIVKNNQTSLFKDIESLQKKISLLEKNNDLLKNLSQHYQDSSNEPENSKENSFDQFAKIYRSDCTKLTKHIQEGSIQTLSYVLHMSELNEQFIDSDPARAKLEVRNIHKNIRDIINQLREVVDEFLPFTSGKKNYACALNQIILRVKMNDPDLVVDTKMDKFDENESEFRCILILKVIMEYCLNVSKHSSAKRLSIEICNMSDTYEIKIQDDGKGFDYDTVMKENDGHGLTSAKYYIELLKGELVFKSRENDGTKIFFSVPKGE